MAKKMKSKLISIILTLVMFAALANQSLMVSAATTNNVNIFKGTSTAGAWNIAVSVNSNTTGGTMDVSELSGNGDFYIEYTGKQEGIQLILQSWCGGKGWQPVSPDKIGKAEDNNYYAKFNSSTIKEIYGDLDTLSVLQVWSTAGEITVKSIEYIDNENNSSEDKKDEDNKDEGNKDEDNKDEGEDTEEDKKALIEETFVPSEENVKVMGRSVQAKDTLWLAQSASGIEYSFTGTKGEVTILGDNVVGSNGAEKSYARVAIYVNNKKVVDELIKEKEQTFNIFESKKTKDVNVKIVKLSESAMSTCGIKNIKVTAKDGIKKAENKKRSIEFIGDSITCGYGVDLESLSASFSTATENATKTYAYKTAEALEADYSMVSYSGYGIISGYTGTGIKNEAELLPKYYDKVAFSYSAKEEIASADWDFNKFKPDLVVINLGTNDDSYCKSDETKQAEFTKEYAEFLKHVREMNPDAQILCTLGIMGDNLYKCIESAVDNYKSVTGDTKVSSMKFDVQNFNDGLAVDYHPSEKTHTKAAAKLTDEIKTIMNW